MVGDTRQGWAILAAMTFVFVVLLALCVGSEQAGNPALTKLGVDQTTTAMQSGANMEGKETRFGIVNSALWATATTSASNGSVNAMHDSFTPLGGLVPMWLMQLGEVIFGGVGSGLYGMLIFAIVAVFVAGLMIGRTPEYLGKKIEAFEMKMAAIAVLMPLIMALGWTAVAVVMDAGKAGVANPGAHGFSEILYAFSSASNNNGSAFAGLSANTPFYNTTLGIAMLFSRYWLAIPVLAIAGALVAKKKVPGEPGHAAHPHAAVRGHAGRRRHHHRGAHLLPGAGARADRRAPGHVWRAIVPRRNDIVMEYSSMSTQVSAPALPPVPALPRRLVTKSIFQQALVDALVKLLPQHQWRNPVMFVVYVGSILTTFLYFQALGGKGEAPAGFILAVTLVAVVHGAVRQLRRGGGRRPQQGAGGGAARGQARRRGEEAERCAA